MRIGGRRAERRTRRGGMWPAAAGSVALHAAVIGALVMAEGAFGGRRPEPRMRAYAVNIVSPPPTVRGAPPAEAPAPNVGGSQPPAAASVPAKPAATPAAAPSKPSPTPAAPKPQPPAPKTDVAPPAPPKQPAHAAPKPPEPRPPPRSESNPRSGSNRPKTPSTAANDGKTPAHGTTSSSPAQPGSTTGPGSGARSAGTGTRGAATGRNPDPNSAGGEGLNVSQRGAECPSPGYCENIVRQVRRWFRRPDGNNGTAQACFTIRQDGSTSDIEVRRVRGGFDFRIAVEEAVEQAGLHRAFGALPRQFGATELPVCVDISPET